MSASARAACTRLIGPRGLAPKAMYSSSSGDVVRGRIARRVRERHGVADERGIDVDVEHRALQRPQVVERQRLAQLGGASSWRCTIVSSSSCAG